MPCRMQLWYWVLPAMSCVQTRYHENTAVELCLTVKQIPTSAAAGVTYTEQVNRDTHVHLQRSWLKGTNLFQRTLATTVTLQTTSST